jgi:hypothetical protein
VDFGYLADFGYSADSAYSADKENLRIRIRSNHPIDKNCSHSFCKNK